MKINLGSFDQLLKSFDPHVVKLSRGGAYFGSGLVAGILVKKYLRLFFLSVIICFFIIKGLEYKHVLNIDWGVLNQICGLRPSTTLNELAMMLYAWSLKNVTESVAGAAGFFVGFNIA